MIFPELTKSCRLCFKNTGKYDVTTAPILLSIIKDHYNIEIESTDKYTKLLCGKCTNHVQSFYWHKKLVASGQELLAERIRMAEQMSHMKIEPTSDMEIPPVENGHAMNAVNKEEDTDEDYDDTMTEAAPSPDNGESVQLQQSQPEVEPAPVPMSVPEEEQEQHQDQDQDQEIRRSREQVRNEEKERDRERRSDGHDSRRRSSRNDGDRRKSRSEDRNDRWECVQPQPVDDENNGDSVPIASRIKIRRQTMVMERPSSPRSAKTSKRRLSVVERISGTERTRSGTVNETASNEAKKRRLSHGVLDKQTPSKMVPKSSPIVESTPQKSKSLNHAKITSATKSRNNSTAPEKLSKSAAEITTISVTPSKSTKITQFFSKTAPFKCDTCPAILNSQNELNFHATIHKRGRCAKCKETIDNHKNCDSVRRHVISCLFANNELPKDYLTHLLKVKVDVNRLTPDKIETIQKGLHPAVTGNDVFKKKPGPKFTQHERYSKRSEIETHSEQQTSDKQVTEKIDDIAVENATDKTVDEAKPANDDDKSTGKKNRSKKTPSKPRTPHSEVSEEFTVTANQTAALNWIDDVIKDKPFVLRNFETDKPIYNHIKAVPNKDGQTDERLAIIIKNINVRKVNAISQTKENSVKSTPAKPTEIQINRSKPIENGTNRTKPVENGNVRAEENVPNVQSPLQPAAVKTSSIPVNPPMCRENLSPISLIQQPLALNLVTPNASPQTILNVTPVVQTLPHLLSLPRLPLRNRALSMHMSQSEYSATARLSDRRQSISDNGPPQTNSPPVQSNTTALDHTYTNVSTTKKQPTILRIPKGNLPPPPYMTKVHHADFLQNRPPPQPQASKTPAQPPTTLKVLTPDDLNSRAMNAAQSAQASPNPRMDSPNSTENQANLNNNQVSSTKRPRIKTTPLRTTTPAPPQLSDDANISISVSLSRVNNDQAELILTLDNQKLDYDNLTLKRQQEVKSSLLKDNVWLKMLNHLKNIQPTDETLTFFEKILPETERKQFFAELREVYGNLIK